MPDELPVETPIPESEITTEPVGLSMPTATPEDAETSTAELPMPPAVNGETPATFGSPEAENTTPLAPEVPVAPPTMLADLPAEEVSDPPVEVPVSSEAAEVVPEAPPEPKPNNKRWYVIKVQSGREESIKDAIERKVRIEGLEEFYGQILIPVERIQELRRGKRVTKSIKLYPGYLFAELEFNDRMLYLFRETSGVGDFVGGGIPGKAPTPMRDSEVESMLNREPRKEKAGEEGTRETPREVVRTRPRFSVGDRLRVIDGNFATMEGEVIDITEDKVKLQVLVLGMPVTLDLDFWQVESL